MEPPEVATPTAELSSLASALVDIQARISAVASRYEGTAREDLANGLYEVERNLATGGRRLEKILRGLR
jgi:hypothetical protein